jgi:hypothetical protein
VVAVTLSARTKCAADFALDVLVRFARYVHHVIGMMVVLGHSFHTLWITLWTNLRGFG